MPTYREDDPRFAGDPRFADDLGPRDPFTGEPLGLGGRSTAPDWFGDPETARAFGTAQGEGAVAARRAAEAAARPVREVQRDGPPGRDEPRRRRDVASPWAAPPTSGPSASPADLSPLSNLARSLGYDTGAGDGGTAGGTTAAAGRGNTVVDRLLQASEEDIPFLRGDPFSNRYTQSRQQQMREAIGNRYETARQRMRDELGARQGFSGVLTEELDRLRAEQAQEESDVERDIFLRGEDERRGRRAESRGILGGLESLERERQREAMGIESGLDARERQALMDLMAALGLAPNLGTASSAAANLGFMNRGGSSGGGFGDLATLLALAGKQ